MFRSKPVAIPQPAKQIIPSDKKSFTNKTSDERDNNSGSDSDSNVSKKKFNLFFSQDYNTDPKKIEGNIETGTEFYKALKRYCHKKTQDDRLIVSFNSTVTKKDSDVMNVCRYKSKEYNEPSNKSQEIQNPYDENSTRDFVVELFNEIQDLLYNDQIYSIVVKLWENRGQLFHMNVHSKERLETVLTALPSVKNTGGIFFHDPKSPYNGQSPYKKEIPNTNWKVYNGSSSNSSRVIKPIRPQTGIQIKIREPGNFTHKSFKVRQEENADNLLNKVEADGILKITIETELIASYDNGIEPNNDRFTRYLKLLSNLDKKDFGIQEDQSNEQKIKKIKEVIKNKYKISIEKNIKFWLKNDKDNNIKNNLTIMNQINKLIKLLDSNNNEYSIKSDDNKETKINKIINYLKEQALDEKNNPLEVKVSGFSPPDCYSPMRKLLASTKTSYEQIKISLNKLATFSIVDESKLPEIEIGIQKIAKKIAKIPDDETFEIKKLEEKKLVLEQEKDTIIKNVKRRRITLSEIGKMAKLFTSCNDENKIKICHDIIVTTSSLFNRQFNIEQKDYEVNSFTNLLSAILEEFTSKIPTFWNLFIECYLMNIMEMEKIETDIQNKEIDPKDDVEELILKKKYECQKRAINFSTCFASAVLANNSIDKYSNFNVFKVKFDKYDEYGIETAFKIKPHLKVIYNKLKCNKACKLNILKYIKIKYQNYEDIINKLFKINTELSIRCALILLFKYEKKNQKAKPVFRKKYTITFIEHAKKAINIFCKKNKINGPLRASILEFNSIK